MRLNFTRFYFGAAVLSFGAMLAGTVQAQGTKPDFLQKYESQGIPSQTRITSFDGASGLPLPQQTKQTANTLVVKAQPFSEQEKEAFVAAAQALGNSDQLKAKLGNESQLLSGGQLPSSKPDAGHVPNQYKFTFYNYQKDQAIEAYVSGGQVTLVKEREVGYQPTVSHQELVQAAEIASKKSAAIERASPESLRGLAQSGSDGRRQIRLYTDQQGKPTAVVDLHSKTVVEVK